MSLIRLARLRGRRDLLDCEASPDAADRMMTDSLVAGGPPMRAIPCPSNAHPAAEKAARAARPTKHTVSFASLEPVRPQKEASSRGGSLKEASKVRERLTREAAARDFEPG